MNHAHPSGFGGLGARLGLATEAIELVWTDLLTRYSEPHRYYHNLIHIDRMLGLLAECHGMRSDALELAIWFHDVIYEPLRKDNEEASACYFRTTFGNRLDAGTLESVERLIMATDPKCPRSGVPDEALLVDIDLSILAAPAGEYEDYRMAIRREYAMVPERKFIEGRLAVLRRFLERPIFLTPWFVARDPQARENLEREIGLLETIQTRLVEPKTIASTQDARE